MSEGAAHRLTRLEDEAVTVPKHQEVAERGDGAGGVDNHAVVLLADHGLGQAPDLPRR